jgi:hypothetical protein
MKKESLTSVIKGRDFGTLRMLVTYSDYEGKRWYWGHCYGPGDDDTSHWWIKRRSEKALLNAMVKKFTSTNKPSAKRRKAAASHVG